VQRRDAVRGGCGFYGFVGKVCMYVPYVCMYLMWVGYICLNACMWV